MRLIDADALQDEYVRLSGRELSLIGDAPTVDVDSLNAKHEDIGYEKGYRDGYAKALEETDNAESVRHGHWKGKPIAGYSTVRCSECGDVFMENSGKWNYCPNCGAYMGDGR